MRPTLRFSSPAPLALPKTTSSIFCGPAASVPASIGWSAAASATAWADAARRPSRPGARSTRVRTTWAAMSSGRTPDSAPPTLPKGVRTASNT